MTTRRLAVATAAALLAAGCGTTVPQAAAPGQDAINPGLGVVASAGAPTGAPVVPDQGGATGGAPVSVPTSGGGDETSPTDPATLGPPAPDRSPLKIGVTYIENSGTSAALGVDDPSTVSKKNIVRALIQGINAEGGAAGRRLVPVEYEWNSQSNDWSGDADSACALFTQDAHVSVVLDNAFGTIGGFRTCLQRAGVFVIQSAPEGDVISSRAAVLHANSTGMTLDRAYAAVLHGLSSTGYLSSKNHVGVMVESCTDNTRAWNRTIKPVLGRLHVPVEEATVGCTNAFANAGTAASDVSSAILRFRRLGVDRVMFVSDNEAVLVLLWASSASSQGYRPGYLLSSAAQAQGLRSQLPADQQPLMHGVGSLPFGDTDQAVPTPADKRCVALVRKAGLAPANQLDMALLVFECGPFLLLDAALRASAGSTSGLRTAVASLGHAFLGPGLVQGATRFAATQLDGPALTRVFGFVPSCSCLRYSGAPFSERTP